MGFQNWTFVELESSQLSIRLASSCKESMGCSLSERAFSGDHWSASFRGGWAQAHGTQRLPLQGQQGKASRLLRGTSEP